MANALAESPSVKINVQFIDFLVPASFASSNLSIPRILYFLTPFNLFAKEAFSLALACITIDSTIPDFNIYYINLSEISGLEPKFETLDVKVSLV